MAQQRAEPTLADVSATGTGTGPPRHPDSHAFTGRRAATAVRWSALAVFAKQGLQLVFGITLARMLGPHAFGVVSLATVYVTFTTLLLDQGLSSALVQRRELGPRSPGAAATVNLVTGVVLAGMTWALAPAVADFFHRDELVSVLRLLGLGLVLKAAAITPRAMLSRQLNLRLIARADVLGAVVGTASGLTAAALGASYSSVVAQMIGTDAVTVALLLLASRGPRPNLSLSEVRTLLPFGARIFLSNGIAYFSRNTDNILVGRYIGASGLSFYGMAYRVLVIPVQLLGQTVNRVLFPAFSRMADDRVRTGRALVAATELLALAAIPAMALVACAAPELVSVGLGAEWAPTAPLISVLALAGARETVFYITPSLMNGLGRADLNLRYEIGATTLQVAGIVAGLHWGVQGVAVGYALAGVAVTPVLMAIQRHLTGITLGRQWIALWPALHATAWASTAYLLVSRADLPDLVTLVLGSTAYAVVIALVLLLVHRTVTVRAWHRVATRKSQKPKAAPAVDRTDPVDTAGTVA